MKIEKLAFLDIYTFDNNAGIMGAILVTDADTKPLEFRVTAPIKPTNFQKTLYGDVLLEHILVELAAVPLLNAINEEIDLILVRNPLFLGVNDKQGVRVVRVFKDDEGKARSGKMSESLPQFIGNGTKTFLETSKKFDSELSEIQDTLSPIAETRNLIEPFERLKVACEQVHLQKTGE
jgi:hypothetical protein